MLIKLVSDNNETLNDVYVFLYPCYESPELSVLIVTASCPPGLALVRLTKDLFTWPLTLLQAVPLLIVSH